MMHWYFNLDRHVSVSDPLGYLIDSGVSNLQSRSTVQENL